MGGRRSAGHSQFGVDASVALVGRLSGLRGAGSATVFWGDADHICEQLNRRRERLGVAYWSFPAAQADQVQGVALRLR